MNKLPNDVLDIIYEFKHQLEYKYCMNELTNIRINCRYIFSLNFVRQAKYRTHENIFKPIIDINDINVNSFEILYVIRKRNN